MNKIYLLIISLLCSACQQSIAQKKLLSQNPQQLHITWDSTTMRKVATGGYARMIELKNGTLITVYAASNGNTEIVRSINKGNEWSAPIVVAAKANEIRMDAPDIILLKRWFFDGML